MHAATIEATGSQSITIDDEGRSDTYDVGYRAEASCIYAPARLYGEPEDCSPDESEINDLLINVTDVQDEQGNEVNDIPALWNQLEEKLDEDKIREKIWEQFMDRGD